MKHVAALFGIFLLFTPLTAQRIVEAPGTFADLEYVPARDALYAVRSAGAADGNTLCRIDLQTGAVVESYPIGADPVQVVATTSGDYLYISLRGENLIRRFSLLTNRIDLEFSVGGEEANDGPYYAADLLPVRGSDDLLAVARRHLFDFYPRSTGTVLFDEGRQLPDLATGYPAASSLVYTDLDNVLLGIDQEAMYQLQQLWVTNTGLADSTYYGGIYLPVGRLEYMNQRLYAPSGEIAMVESGVPTPLTTLYLEGVDQYAPVGVEPDAIGDRLYYLAREYYNGRLNLYTFELTTLAPLSVQTINPYATPSYNGESVRELEKVGGEGLAYLTTDNLLRLLYLCPGGAVPPAYSGPTTICTGQPLLVTLPAGSVPEGGTVRWSNGQIGDTIYVTQSGEYTYRIEDATGCPGPVSPPFYLNESYYGGIPYIIDPLTRAICTGGSVELRAESPYGTPIVWNTGDTTPVLIVTEPGTYVAYATEPNSECLSEPSAPLELYAVDAPAPPAPTVDQGLRIDTCTTDIVELSVSDFAQEYFWTFEYAYYEQRSTADDVVRVYPTYEPTRFTVRTKGFNDCLSPATVGRLTFLTPPDAPVIQYNESTTTLAASRPGPLLWYYQDELEGESSGRYYQPLRNGFYTARVKGADCPSGPSNMVSVEGVTTSVHDDAVSARVSVHPVPARGVVYVSMDHELAAGFSGGTARYQLFNSSGSAVSEGRLDPHASNNPIAIAGLAAGVYVLRLESTERGIVRKRITVF
ncbi:hypothetical protein [Lewinella sp. IMCC34183]|uniref:hypothetical protein n=1 Tax=Lewinella sp. IMCC34183 TaxID=2248762 RepID=UPI000E248A50|nr:hypothetical protein [Lewinella sp. IMCC34183]